MDTIDKIEVSAELAKELIPILEDQIDKLDGHIVSLEMERDAKKRTLAEIQARLNGHANATVSQNGKRIKKGEGVKIIEGLLRSVPGNTGLEMGEIVKRSGVPYSSVFRSLRNAKVNKGRFIEDSGRWKMAKI